MKTCNLCIAVFLFLFVAQLCAAEEITVAAAADLQFAFQDLATRFEKETGKHVKLIFGSSGNFFAQIQNGAPFDLFFSADVDYPKRLEAAGLAEPGTIYPYAKGKIVIWARNESKFDLSRGLQVLLDPGIRKIAIANPDHAPYDGLPLLHCTIKIFTIRFSRNSCSARTSLRPLRSFCRAVPT